MVQKTGAVLRALWELFVKILLVLFMLPAAFLCLLSLFGFGMLLILLIQGYPLVGATMVLLGCVLGFGAFSLFILTFVVAAGRNRGRDGKDVEA